jgi:hypothetical protein
MVKTLLLIITNMRTTHSLLFSVVIIMALIVATPALYTSAQQALGDEAPGSGEPEVFEEVTNASDQTVPEEVLASIENDATTPQGEIITDENTQDENTETTPEEPVKQTEQNDPESPKATEPLADETVHEETDDTEENEVDFMATAFPMTALVASASTVLDATLTSLNSQNFPFVYMNVRVTEDGAPLTTLSQSDFLCTENGQTQTDSFVVTPPETGGGVRLADIVFLIDASGSMSGAITGVRNNVIAFAGALSGSGIDYRLGLVQFGQSTNGGNPILMNNGALTDDAVIFEGLVSTLRASGGYEPSFLALRMAAQNFNFRPGAQKIFILITDEDSDDRNKQGTIDLMLANDVTVHIAATCTDWFSQGDYCDDTSVRALTGGTLFGVQGPYDAILDTIAAQAASTYVIRYKSSNPAFDGTQRDVMCTISDQGAQTTVTGSYIPGSAPKITLTPATIALNDIAIPENSPNAIVRVIVTDTIAPFVVQNGVKLHYRTLGSTGAYTPVVMTEASGEYSATIPVVKEPGIQYYITATDGEQTSSLPTNDPSISPFGIAVLPNEKPVIVHTPITSAQTNQAITISADVTDATTYLDSVTLGYRQTGELLYTKVAMQNKTGDTYEGTIPASVVTTDIEYYIKAEDNWGTPAWVGSEEDPNVISVGVSVSNQCGDGNDNDGDGFVDFADPGCSLGFFAHEYVNHLERLKNRTIDEMDSSIVSTTPDFAEAINYFSGALAGNVIDFGLNTLVSVVKGMISMGPEISKVESTVGILNNMNETDFSNFLDIAANSELGFTVADLESISELYQIGAHISVEKMKLILFVEWLLGKNIEKKLQTWLESFRTFLIADLPSSTVSDVNTKVKTSSDEIHRIYNEVLSNKYALNWGADYYSNLHIHKRIAANDLMADYYRRHALKFSTFANMKDDSKFKASQVFYSGSKGVGYTALTMMGCVPCVIAVKADFVGELGNIAGSAVRNKDMYLLGSDVLRQSGVYRSPNSFDFPRDIVGAMSSNAEAVFLGLLSEEDRWSSPSGRILGYAKTGESTFSIDIENTGAIKHEYIVVATSFIPKTAHHLFNGLMTWNYDLPFTTIAPLSGAWLPLEGSSRASVTIDLLRQGYGVTNVRLLEKTKDGIFFVGNIDIPADDVKKGFFNNMFAGKIYSPGEIQARDEQGRITGLVNGMVFEEIPDSFYDEENHAFVIFDSSDVYTYTVTGTDSGLYGLELNAIVGGAKEQLFLPEIPITPGVVHKYVPNWSNNSISIYIDKNGDGVPEHTIDVGDSFSDTLAPTTTDILSGTLLTTDTYLGTTTLTLTAEDNEGGVGVESTEYSFDGETWIEYVTPVEVTEEGAHTISYRSTDWFGNTEEIKSVTFTIILDTVSPVTTLSAEGRGNSPWFRSDIEVTLVATDDKTDVASTIYSLDDGATWNLYTAPFTLSGEGEHTVLYRSTDKAGNTEDVKTVTLYIDLTAPEAKLSANVFTKDLFVAGNDNMGETTVLKTTTGYTITDEAGHTTKLFVSKKWAGKTLTMAQLTGIQYDNAPVVTFPKTQLLYVWTPWKGTTNLTNQTVHVNKTFTVTATYLKPLDSTTITISQNRKRIKPQTFPGLTLVTLTTEKGVVGYEL